MNSYPQLRAAIIERHPGIKEAHVENLTHATLHETAHFFWARVLNVPVFDLGVRRSGGGHINAFAYDARDLIILMAGIAMELHMFPDGSSENSMLGDARDLEGWVRTLQIPEDRAAALLASIGIEIQSALLRDEVFALIEETAARIIKHSRKNDGRLTVKKTDNLCVWLDGELKRRGLCAELSRVADHVASSHIDRLTAFRTTANC
ncbi:histidine kinase [Thauera mechernichensis]|uniref:Histidine kinase n=1 Tax=Thauera mechernichensis TaxID=82788 RepID=A0ABW3WGT3_9RHOO|nr:histidine kinase [Thauera mechernichensis]MDG3064829.1 histidine kinase [Thauera mechernichensis]